MNLKARNLITFFLIFIYLMTQSAFCEGIFRLKASTPKELIEGIYNNVLIGNDRLSDIESYMSFGLKSDYKKALKFTKKGGNCDVPRILSNGIFSGKLKGFTVDQSQEDGWTAEVSVTLNTGHKNLSSDEELKKFDPKIYELIKFKLVKRFVDWKIDNIKASSPNIDSNANPPAYQLIDLRERLKSCNN